MVSTASTNALPMNCPWRNKLSPSPRPRRGVHIVKVCPVDNIYLLCYTATCLSSIAGTGYSSPFPSHQGVHTRWFGRALEWHSRGQRFDPAYLHHTKTLKPQRFQGFLFVFAGDLTRRFSNTFLTLTEPSSLCAGGSTPVSDYPGKNFFGAPERRVQNTIMMAKAGGEPMQSANAKNQCIF